MNIDHHIQQTMINRLAESSGPVKYNDLKGNETENSLFSYHLNKLIYRGIVQKSDNGYTLTVEGARWLNDNGVVMRAKKAPRVFVALVIHDGKSSYLIGQRTGQFKVAINDYILPSCEYTNDIDLPDQIDEAIASFIPEGKLADRSDRGFMQIKAIYDDNVVMRSLFHITVCKVDEFEPLRVYEASEYEWLDRLQIEKIDHPSATILREIIDLITGEQSQFRTPLIIG